MKTFLRRLSVPGRRRAQTSPGILGSEGSLPEEKPPPVISPTTSRTASNALYFALRTLSSISTNIPVGAILSSVIDPLLLITARIDQTSTNEQGLTQLAARIDLLAPIVSEMAEKNPSKAQRILEALQKELQLMTEDLEVASSQGKINQFFNSADNASSLAKHNMTLDRLIADSTLAAVHQVSQSVQEIERSITLESSPSEAQIVLAEVIGGLGGTGGDAHRGGEGGDGEGPKLEMDPDESWKVGNVSGGKGGKGGTGVEVGGKGGTGKAPVISVVRRRTVLVAEPEAQEEKGGKGGTGVEVGGKGRTGEGPVISVSRRRTVLVAEPEAQEEERPAEEEVPRWQ